MFLILSIINASLLFYYFLFRTYLTSFYNLFPFLDCIEIAAAFLQHATFCCPLEQLDEQDIQETQVISLKQKGWKNRLLGAVYLQYYNTNKKNTTYSKENVKSITGKKSYGTFCFKIFYSNLSKFTKNQSYFPPSFIGELGICIPCQLSFRPILRINTD